MALSGVRSSWLIAARNSDFVVSACTAASRASSAACWAASAASRAARSASKSRTFSAISAMRSSWVARRAFSSGAATWSASADSSNSSSSVGTVPSRRTDASSPTTIPRATSGTPMKPLVRLPPRSRSRCPTRDSLRGSCPGCSSRSSTSASMPCAARTRRSPSSSLSSSTAWSVPRSSVVCSTASWRISSSERAFVNARLSRVSCCARAADPLRDPSTTGRARARARRLAGSPRGARGDRGCCSSS